MISFTYEVSYMRFQNTRTGKRSEARIAEILDGAATPVKRSPVRQLRSAVSRVHGHISTDSRCAESVWGTRKGGKDAVEDRQRRTECDRVAFCSYLARTNFHASRILHGATNNYRHYAVDIQIAFLTPTGRPYFMSRLFVFSSSRS